MGYGRYRQVNIRKTTPMMIPQCEVKKLMNRQSGKPKGRFGVSTACNVPPIPQKYATSNQRWFPVHIATITTTIPQSHSCIGSMCCQTAVPRASTMSVQERKFKSTNSPQVSRNDIGDPGNITRQLLDGSGIFLHRYYEQICFHRLNKILCSQSGVSADAACFDRDVGRAGRQDEFLHCGFLILRSGLFVSLGTDANRFACLIERRDDPNNIKSLA